MTFQKINGRRELSSVKHGEDEGRRNIEIDRGIEGMLQ